eukprot:817665-Rhodomonas_salina.1
MRQAVRVSRLERCTVRAGLCYTYLRPKYLYYKLRSSRRDRTGSTPAAGEACAGASDSSQRERPWRGPAREMKHKKPPLQHTVYHECGFLWLISDSGCSVHVMRDHAKAASPTATEWCCAPLPLNR